MTAEMYHCFFYGVWKWSVSVSGGSGIRPLYFQWRKSAAISSAKENVFETIEKKEEITNFIDSIDNEYNDIIITTKLRKEYYLKTLELRINKLKDYINRINK